MWMYYKYRIFFKEKKTEAIILGPASFRISWCHTHQFINRNINYKTDTALSCCPDALNQKELFCCNISWCVWIFNKAQQLLNMPPLCVCVCDQCYSNEPDKPECRQCLQLGRCQPEWPSSPPDWCWTQICWRWAICLVPPVPGQAAGEGRAKGPHTSSIWLWTDLVEWRWTEIEVRQDRQETWETKQLRKCRGTGGGIDKPVQKQKAMLEIGEIGEYKRRSRMEKWKERETSLRYTEKKIEMRHYRQRTEKWKKTGYKENWVIYWTVLSQHYSVFLFKSESITQNWSQT